MYLLTYAIVDTEINNSWKWFMTNLKIAIGAVSNFVFVSNRHPTITNAVEAIFPTSYHRLCTYHLNKNIEMHFKDKAVIKLFNSA